MRWRCAILVALVAALLTMLTVPRQSHAAPPTRSAFMKVVSSNHYADSTTLRVVGLVQNTTGTPQQNIRIFVSLYNSKHKVIGGTTAAPFLTVVPAHSMSPFNIEITNAPSGLHSIVFKVKSNPVAQLVSILNYHATPYGAEIQLSGSLQNATNSRVSVVTVAAAALDASGHVIDAASSTCCIPALEPGAIETYSMIFPHAAGATRFAVYAQATPSP